MLENATRVFGQEFIAYTLGSDSSAIPINLSPRQVEVATEIEILAAALSQFEPLRLHSTIELLFQNDTQNPLSDSIRGLRLSCRGEEDVATISGDAVTDVLLGMCRDAFPITLIASSLEASPGFMSWGHIFEYSAIRHPHFEKCCDTILNDECLAQLFPGGFEARSSQPIRDVFEIQSEATWSNGSGGTLQLATAVSALVQRTFDAIPPGGATEQHALLHCVQETVRTARSLASGRLTPTRALFALSNIHLEQDQDFGSFKLRAPSKADRRLLLTEQTDFCVMEIAVDIRLMDVFEWPPPSDTSSEDLMQRFGRHVPAFNAFQKDFSRRFDHARFALLLSRPVDQIIAPVFMSSTVLNPLTAGGSTAIARDALTGGIFPSQVVTVAEAVTIRHWANRIAQQPESLDMGTRRLVNAATNRPDPMDGFIDSVISWENLFGTSEGESTFRVCGAMANVICPDDPAAREPLMKELQGLYSARSRLVHGGQEPDGTTADAHRRRAIELAIETFQAVHERPEILSIRTSALRGRMAVLGF